MSDEAAIKRSLKIKTGVVKRQTKENSLYRKEIETLRAQADGLEREGGDEWHVKNAHNLVHETERTLETTVKQLMDAVGALRDLVASVENDARIGGDESLAAAKEALKEAHALAGTGSAVDA